MLYLKWSPPFLKDYWRLLWVSVDGWWIRTSALINTLLTMCFHSCLKVREQLHWNSKICSFSMPVIFSWPQRWNNTLFHWSSPQVMKTHPDWWKSNPEKQQILLRLWENHWHHNLFYDSTLLTGFHPPHFLIWKSSCQCQVLHVFRDSSRCKFFLTVI